MSLILIEGMKDQAGSGNFWLRRRITEEGLLSELTGLEKATRELMSVCLP